MPALDVSNTTTSAANRIQDSLEERDALGIAITALSAAGGVIVAQSVADRVMNLLNKPMNPQSVSDYGASIITKTVIALTFGVVAAQLSGLALIGAAFMGMGALASAGADAIEGLLTTSPLGEDNPLRPPTSSGSSSSRPRRSRSSSGNRSSSSSSSGSGQTAASSGW